MNQDNAVLYILGALAIFIIAIYITRAIFSIPALVKHSKAQTALLIEIAKKHGVTNEQVSAVLNANGVYGADIGFKGYD